MRASHLLTVATLALWSVALAPQPAFADISEAAEATAVLNDRGKPVGLDHYEDANDAVRAGDMAAYLTALEDDDENEITTASIRALILSVDQLADGDTQNARRVLASVRDGDEDSPFHDYINSWIHAFSGEESEAISKHRAASNGLPGNSGDLSLASMLEGLGRNEEALAVYESLIPNDIEAPEHDFAFEGLYFAHVRTVVSRQAILLRKLGRIEEAKESYRKLAEAEPERAVGYAAAIEQLETGDGLDDELFTPRTAFARTLFDISNELALQRVFRLRRLGQPTNTFDYTKSSIDQAALLLTPEDNALRGSIVSALHRQTYYNGAAHVALSAPEVTPQNNLSAAFALMLQQEETKARKALADALAGTPEPDEEMNVTVRAANLYSLLYDDKTALKLADKVFDLAENDSERAIANSVKSTILQHLGRYEEALPYARKAAEIDNTTDRRTFVTAVLGELGQNEEALKTLRRELFERPNDPNAMNALGYYLISHTDELDQAYRLLFRATSLVPRSPHILDSFGWARYKYGDLDVAERVIEGSKDLISPEKNWEIEDHLGDIYWHRGKEEKAREAWQSALEVFPPKRYRANIEKKLKDGITEDAPEKRKIPLVSLEEETALEERDI